MKTCAYNECQEIVVEDYIQESSDRPYCNIYFHKTCYKKLMEEVIDDDGLMLYLAKNPDLWYNIREKLEKRAKNRWDGVGSRE